MHADFRCLKLKFRVIPSSMQLKKKMGKGSLSIFSEFSPEPGTFGLWGSLDVKKRELYLRISWTMTVETTTCRSSKLEEPATIHFNPATKLLKVFPTQHNSHTHVNLTENKAFSVKVYEIKKQ
jgi:hypothetical protein